MHECNADWQEAVFLRKRKKHLLFTVTAVLLIAGIVVSCISLRSRVSAQTEQGGFIKWVDFNVPYAAMERALEADVKAHSEQKSVPWVDVLAYLGTKYGGTWSRYKAKDLDAVVALLKEGKTIEELTADMKHFSYFKEAYDAVLGGFVGSYKIAQAPAGETGADTYDEKYGLKAYSPLAYGYNFSHYDDFGNSRSFGFTRRHLGNDLVGSVGTPVVAVESGYVECLGWNRYGGWRIGIRSFDKKRYYYYAHLRKNRPYAEGLKEGQIVNAGDVIGYLGMTGYSDKENVNGMTIPHLHFGLQLIFDESQKESNNEIWVDLYSIVNLLQKHRSPVLRNDETKEYTRKYKFIDPVTEAYIKSGQKPEIVKRDPTE